MKIAWLHDRRGAWGGAEANVLASARALLARGHENHLLYREDTGRESTSWNEVFSTSTCLSEGLSAAAVLDELKPDVAWMHNWEAYSEIPGLQRMGFGLARMLHDHATYCLRSYKYHPITRQVCHRPASLACVFPCAAIVRRGSGRFPVIDPASLQRKFEEIRANRELRNVVVASSYMRGECLKNGFSPEAVTILPPVSPGGGTPSDESRMRPGRLLFAGQLIRGKGLDVLLDALKSVRGNWHLDVAGDGKAMDSLKRRAASPELAGRVTFHGHLTPSQMEDRFAEAEVVVFPSMWPEPFGLVGVEAMRRGKPVVAFDVGGVSAWLEHERTGLLVPWGDQKKLAAALDRLLASPGEARRMGETGRAVALKKFSFDGYIDQLENYLTGLSPHSHS